MPPRATTWRTTCGSSHAPGQRTIVTASASPPDRTIASSAPAISGSTMRPLNRLATIANRSPCADRVPSMVCGMLRRYTPSSAPTISLRRLVRFAAFRRGAAGDRNPLDDLDPEALEPGDLAIAPHHQADPLEPEVGEHLGAEAEVAQRLARIAPEVGHRARLGALQDQALERRPEPGPAGVDDVEQPADADLVDRLARGRQPGPQPARIDQRAHRRAPAQTRPSARRPPPLAHAH